MSAGRGRTLPAAEPRSEGDSVLVVQPDRSEREIVPPLDRMRLNEPAVANLDGLARATSAQFLALRAGRSVVSPCTSDR